MANEHSRNGELCPACGEGRLHSHVEDDEFEYNGAIGMVPMRFSVCDHCRSELTGAVESRLNKRAVNAFKKSAAGLLAGTMIREFRHRFELSQEECAALFGGGAVAFSRYENDDIIQSTSMDRMLRLCIEEPLNIARLAKMAKAKLTEATHTAIQVDIEARLAEIARKAQIEIDKNAAYRPSKTSKSANDSHSAPADSYGGKVTQMESWRRKKAA